MHDRVRAVDALELRVVPGSPLRALVLAVPDLDRRRLQCGRGRRGVEDELDHLPVAFMEVVPVVEDVEEPVLERELARVSGVGDDVRVCRGRPLGPEVLLPVQVVATRMEGVAGEVQVIAVQAVAEVLGLRRDLDEIVPPWPSQRHRRLAEEQVDVDRDVAQTGAAALVPPNEAHDGCVARGEGAVLREVRAGRAHASKRCGDGHREDQRPQHWISKPRDASRRAHTLTS